MKIAHRYILREHLGPLVFALSALTSLLQLRRRERAPADAMRDGPPTAEALAAQLVTDALIVRAEADLRWLDVCEARVVQTRNSRA